MEDYLVKDLLSAHPKEWYREKISKFAHAGGLNEKKFYRLIDFPYPGDNNIPIGSQTRMKDEFTGVIEELPPEAEAASHYKQGLTQTTARENLDIATQKLKEVLKVRLHDGKPCVIKALEKEIGSL
jgi:hypothetical protein